MAENGGSDDDQYRMMAMADAGGLDPTEADAWAPRSAKPQKQTGGFGLAPAIGEDNETYAKQYNTD